MKSNAINLTTLLFALLLSVTTVSGQGKLPHQDPNYGTDSASRIVCAMNISLYSEFYKQQNFKDALKPWRQVYNNCPKASKNTFIKGATIFKNLIANEKNAAIKDKLIDTLMQLYDKRIEYFGEKGTVLSFKGAELYGYKGNDVADQVYPMIKEAMQLEGEESKAAVVTIYMQTAVSLYKTSKIEGNEVIEAYSFAMETLEKAMKFNQAKLAQGGKDSDKVAKEIENITTSIGNVEALFSESGAATCDALISIFEAKYNENIENIDWLKKVTKLLNKSECTESELFAKASEQQYKLDPSAESAHNLAKLFYKKKQFEKSSKYFEESCKLETEPVTKAIYYYEWSALAMEMDNLPKVREYSLEALKYNPADGRPYILIGRAYAVTKGIGQQDVERNSVYWAAVDSFNKAKQVDTSLTATANELITTYSQYFPKYEEWFMAVGSKEGDVYTVGGWINVNTKIRF
ncbi:MAG: hypothetical protein WCX31_11725 [Salinivirgaceae bacterium]